MARRRCKYGKLKHKVGGRICRRRPARRARRHSRKRWNEAARWKRDYDRAENAAMGRYRRKRR